MMSPPKNNRNTHKLIMTTTMTIPSVLVLFTTLMMCLTSLSSFCPSTTTTTSTNIISTVVEVEAFQQFQSSPPTKRIRRETITSVGGELMAQYLGHDDGGGILSGSRSSSSSSNNSGTNRKSVIHGLTPSSSSQLCLYHRHRYLHNDNFEHDDVDDDDDEDGCDDQSSCFSSSSSSCKTNSHDMMSRRDLLVSSSASMFLASATSAAAANAVPAVPGTGGGSTPATGSNTGGLLQQFSSGMYVVDAKDQTNVAAMASVVTESNNQRTITPEYALLKTLPVKNSVFRTIEQNLESLSALRYPDGPVISDLSTTTSLSNDTTATAATTKSTTSSTTKFAKNSTTSASGTPPSSSSSSTTTVTSSTNSGGSPLDSKTWSKAGRAVATAISLIDNKRPQLEPIFNPDDSTELSIQKAERGEVLLQDLKQNLEQLRVAIDRRNTTCTFEEQRKALLNLSYLGELLVKEFPYRVPSKGKYSFLPRLLGRTKVTFRFKRPSLTGGKILGDVVVIADGFSAPITAGNFVDLCLRQFYTGLPVRASVKAVGRYQDLLSIPDVCILGSFNEGFYDPLTGKLRKIPLEIIRLEGTVKLSYSSSRRLPGQPNDWGDFEDLKSASVTSRPLLGFDIPSLLAFNHPSYDRDGGSSEFFGLQQRQQSPEDGSNVDISNNQYRRNNHLLDGQYAPFGFIIEGLDVFNSLQENDIIESTIVDDFGALNLKFVTHSFFSNNVW